MTVNYIHLMTGYYITYHLAETFIQSNLQCIFNPRFTFLTHPTQWEWCAAVKAPGEQLEVGCLAQRHFDMEQPGFKRTTLRFPAHPLYSTRRGHRGLSVCQKLTEETFLSNEAFVFCSYRKLQRLFNLKNCSKYLLYDVSPLWVLLMWTTRLLELLKPLLHILQEYGFSPV
uniref:Uncharacterized protein n=1 Tax=Gasterosteus aculeatus TaxID=69293 RepID=G3NL01_GASAC